MDAYINGVATPKGTTFAAIIDGKPYVYRLPVSDGATTNNAELTALLFVLNGVATKPKVKLSVYTNSKYVQSMLVREADGKWAKQAISNKELIDEVREKIVMLQKFEVKFDNESETFKSAHKLARTQYA